jgi:hypothetical protein
MCFFAGAGYACEVTVTSQHESLLDGLGLSPSSCLQGGQP